MALRNASIPHLSISHNSSGESSPEISHVEVVEGFLHSDAEKLRLLFTESYDKIRDNLSRPYVLIAGTTGSGKSSIINTLFGKNIANEGCGRPITQNFTKYESETQPVVLYDSKGLEAGMNFEDFLSETFHFFSENESDIHPNHLSDKLKHNPTILERKIHMIWYVINGASSRFQDFEERLCKELFGRLPIVFLINKADLCTKSQIKILKEIIESLNLPNCIGVYETVTAKYQVATPPEKCKYCGEEEDLIIKKRSKVVICENCNNSMQFNTPKGLKNVIKATHNALPTIVKEAFISSQKINFRLKDEKAKEIITEFYTEQSSVYSSQGYTLIISKMLTRLSILWDFKDHGHLLASHIAKDIMQSFSLRDKIFLFIHKNKHQQLRATAIGIIWNRSVRELAKIVLIESVECISTQIIEKNWHNILDIAFKGLKETEIDLLEKSLENQSLQEVLDSENTERHTSIHREILTILGYKATQNAIMWDSFVSPSLVMPPFGSSPKTEDKN